MSELRIEELWREVGLPEYFLGNGGTNHKLYALYQAVRADQALEARKHHTVSVTDAWQDLCDKDDRTSPEEYPDMCLITREEIADFMSRASLPTKADHTDTMGSVSPYPLSRVPADQIISQIETLFPDWRSYRDLVDCIECTLHRLKEDSHVR